MAAPSKPNYITAPDFTPEQQLQGEKETLGFYLSGHPLDCFQAELSQFVTCRIVELHPHIHQNARAAGIITNIRTRQTKRGDRFAIFTIDDGSTQMEVVCFSECYQKHRPLIVEDQLVIIEGEISIDEFNNSTRMMSREIYSLDQAREKFAKYLQIHIEDFSKLDAEQFKRVINEHRGGKCPIVLRHQNDQVATEIKFAPIWSIKPSSKLLDKLQGEFALKTVQLVY